MSEHAKTARKAMKSKAYRLASGGPKGPVDGSSFVPEPDGTFGLQTGAKPKPRAVETITEPSKAEERLKTLNPDELTPRQALEMLYELKGLAG